MAKGPNLKQMERNFLDDQEKEVHAELRRLHAAKREVQIALNSLVEEQRKEAREVLADIQKEIRVNRSKIKAIKDLRKQNGWKAGKEQIAKSKARERQRRRNKAKRTWTG